MTFRTASINPEGRLEDGDVTPAWFHVFSPSVCWCTWEDGRMCSDSHHVSAQFCLFRRENQQIYCKQTWRFQCRVTTNDGDEHSFTGCKEIFLIANQTQMFPFEPLKEVLHSAGMNWNTLKRLNWCPEPQWHQDQSKTKWTVIDKNDHSFLSFQTVSVPTDFHYMDKKVNGNKKQHSSSLERHESEWMLTEWSYPFIKCRNPEWRAT